MDVEALVVGAGFAGMMMVHRLREAGVSVRCVEAGSDVGVLGLSRRPPPPPAPPPEPQQVRLSAQGTWYWNRYPGARCDTESMEYSYQFDAGLEQDWSWSEYVNCRPAGRPAGRLPVPALSAVHDGCR